MTRAMKDSGIEWIGQIPENWNISKLKNIAKIKTGNTPSKENGENYYASEGLLWVKPDNLLAFSYIKNTKEFLSDAGKSIARVVPAFTPLVCCIGSIGKFGIANQEVSFNQQINAVLFHPDKINSKYGLYYISCQEEQHWFYSNGNVVKILNTEEQGKILFPLPPLSEQKKIADYLDKRCEEIDTAIDNQKQIIEKLKEYKQSLITETVTKGLTPNVKLKDSGIEWIGSIPEHWNIIRGKNALSLMHRPVSSDMEVITCFRDGEVILRKYRREKGFTFSDKEIGYQGIKVGDLVIHGMDGFAGAIGISKSYGKGSPVLNVCNAKDGINLDYICYFLRNMADRNLFIALSTGIRERSCDLKWNKIANLLLPQPPLSEQKEIAEYLDKKCNKIDAAIKQKEETISKLEEYKKSLIFECVTGKKEVA